MSYLLGVDVGTSSVKCVLFNQEGKTVASGMSEYKLIMTQPDFVEVNPETYWTAFKKSLALVLKESKIYPQDISGIGISSQGETFLAVDKYGRPLINAIVWLDNRSKDEAQLISNELGIETIYRVTGQNEVTPTWTATKILWLKRNKPSIFRKVHKFLLLEDYMIYRLTGKYVTEYSIVCSSLLYNISSKCWWDEILSFVGISENHLPEIKAPGICVGNISAKAAKQIGLKTNTIVSTGAYDQAANALGVGNVRAGIVTETTGAALAVVATLDHVVLDIKRRVPCHSHVMSGRYFLQPWCPTAGVLLRWYRDNFGQLEIQEAVKGKADPYDLLMHQASKVPLGSEGLILLPHFMGAASPEFNSNAKGVLFGLTLSHRKGHVIRAIIESVAYMLRRNIELLAELGVKVYEIRSTGGAARSSLWNQIKSDVLQKPIVTVRTEETAALGVAMLAGSATGLFDSLEDAIKTMVVVKERYEPSNINKDLYDKYYQKYLNLYQSVESLF